MKRTYKEPWVQTATNLLRAGVADGYNLPPVPLMIATRDQVLHLADKNTLIWRQTLGSHSNNMEEANTTACTEVHRLKQPCCFPVCKIFQSSNNKELLNLYILLKHLGTVDHESRLCWSAWLNQTLQVYLTCVNHLKVVGVIPHSANDW